MFSNGDYSSFTDYFLRSIGVLVSRTEVTRAYRARKRKRIEREREGVEPGSLRLRWMKIEVPSTDKGLEVRIYVEKTLNLPIGGSSRDRVSRNVLSKTLMY